MPLFPFFQHREQFINLTGLTLEQKIAAIPEVLLPLDSPARRQLGLEAATHHPYLIDIYTKGEMDLEWTGGTNQSWVIERTLTHRADVRWCCPEWAAYVNAGMINYVCGLCLDVPAPFTLADPWRDPLLGEPIPVCFDCHIHQTAQYGHEPRTLMICPRCHNPGIQLDPDQVVCTLCLTGRR